jgi:hypothetical protein
MKLNHYRQAFKYMTRPDTRPAEVKNAEELKRAKAEFDRKNKKRAEYDLPPLIDPKKFVELTNLYDGNNFVVDDNGQITDEASLKKRFENEVIAKTKELSEDKITTGKDLVKKFDNNDPSTYPSNPEQRRKLLTPQKVDVLKKEKPKPKPAINYKDIEIPTIDVETYKSIIQQQEPKPQQVPEARYNGPIENDPQYRNTIFGSDAYYRRKRNL